MTKPHEQEWTQGRDNWSIREAQTDTLRAQVYTDDQTASEADDVARFISAAPDMARALLAIRARVAEAGKALPRERNADQMAAMEDSHVTISTELLRDAFAALRKAGALP